jgi:ubiquinone/menaquinone biosynthesis C-methylase UbiE
MATTTPPGNDQHAVWNGPSAQAWIDLRDVLDETLRPFEGLLVEAVLTAQGRRVLDVGCGTGATTLAVARRLGAAGRITGIDISAPMIAVARGRATEDGATADFICADAEEHTFAPASFDAIMSRFGIMFFNDPIRAFANLRRAASDGAELTCLAWRSPAENPFMTTAERAAAPLLPNMPPRRLDGPGQFAWADDRKVRRILEESGWKEIDVRPIDMPSGFPATELERYVARLGPAGQAIREADDDTRRRVVDAVRAAFDPYVDGATVRFTAACWLVRARAAAA